MALKFLYILHKVVNCVWSDVKLIKTSLFVIRQSSAAHFVCRCRCIISLAKLSRFIFYANDIPLILKCESNFKGKWMKIRGDGINQGWSHPNIKLKLNKTSPLNFQKIIHWRAWQKFCPPAMCWFFPIGINVYLSFIWFMSGYKMQSKAESLCFLFISFAVFFFFTSTPLFATFV